jgi:hypothetical protein
MHVPLFMIPFGWHGMTLRQWAVVGVLTEGHAGPHAWASNSKWLLSCDHPCASVPTLRSVPHST